MRKYLTVVVGGTYEGFRQWCHDNQVAPTHALYADSIEKLQGLELQPSDVVDLGGAPQEIYDMLKTRYR